MEVVAVRSSEGEVIALTQIISTAKARGQVEKWLVQLEASVKSSIKKVKYHPKKNTVQVRKCLCKLYIIIKIQRSKKIPALANRFITED